MSLLLKYFHANFSGKWAPKTILANMGSVASQVFFTMLNDFTQTIHEIVSPLYSFYILAAVVRSFHIINRKKGYTLDTLRKILALLHRRIWDSFYSTLPEIQS